MFDPEDKPAEANGSPAATVDGDQQGIVGKAEWKEALDLLAKTDPDKAAALSKKLEGYDRVLTKKTQELSQREREIKEVAEKLSAAASKAPSGSVGQKMKILDAQIESTTDPAQREGLRQLKDAIREESEERLRELEAKWEKKFQDSEHATRATARVGLSKEINALKEVYGEELIEEYKGEIEANSLKYPGAYSPDRWLHTVADPEKLRQALRIRLRKEAPKPNGDQGAEKKQPASPVSSTKPLQDNEKYKGKNPAQTRVGFGKALDDSLGEGMRKLGLVR